MSPRSIASPGAHTGDMNGIELLTKGELSKRLRRKGDLLVLGVRPAEKYGAGHFPGAVSDPGRRRLPPLEGGGPARGSGTCITNEMSLFKRVSAG